MSSKGVNENESATCSRLTRDYDAAVSTLTAAEAVLAQANQNYYDALGLGREAAAAALRTQSDAELDCDIARRSVEIAADRIEAAKRDRAAAEVGRLEDLARSSIAAFAAAAERDLKIMTSKARSLLELWVDAHLAREAAIRAGGDEDELPMVEGFRMDAGLPAREIEVKRVARWLNPYTGDPLSDEQNSRVREHQGGAILMRTDGGQPFHLTEKAEFERVVYVEREPGVRFVSLPEALGVPASTAAGAPGWDPQGVRSPRAVMERLQNLKQAPSPGPRDRRERLVKYRPLPKSSPSVPASVAEPRDVELRSLTIGAGRV